MSNFDDFGSDLRSSYQKYLNKKTSIPPAPAPETIDLQKQRLYLANTKMTKNLSQSLSKYEELKTKSIQPSSPTSSPPRSPSPISIPQSNPSPSTDPLLESPFSIRLCYEAQRLTLPSIPSSFESLNSQIESLLVSSKKPALSSDDFRLYFYDPCAEKCIVEQTSDLLTAYSFAQKATPPILKLCIDIRRGINTTDSDQEHQSIRRKWNYNDKRYLDESDGEEDDEKYYIKDFELEDQVLMREGYLYRRAGPYNKSYKGFVVCMFNCADNVNGCTGKWENMPLMFNGEFGRLSIGHSLNPEKHSQCLKKKMGEKYAKALIQGLGGNNEILTKEESLEAIRCLAKNDPNLTSAQILAQVKSAFPNAHLPERKHIHSIVGGQRFEQIKAGAGLRIVDISGIKTLRKTDFGREVKFSLIDGKPKYFLHFYSDFQEQVAKEALDDPYLHLFVDGTFKCCPKVFSQLLNVCVLHRKKKLYIPICHILMQTQRYEGYVHALNWIKDTFKLNPRFLTVDFEIAAIRAVREIFPSTSLVPCFFHFVKCLWMNAQKCGLRKKKLVIETKQLIFSLKSLAFRPPKRIYKRFEYLKSIYDSKGPNFKSFLEYFETTWMDGTFQIKDWNYHDKLSEFEDLAITNNGLESFHQIIKSQLRRITPSFKGFLEVLSRAETLKKADYDEDRVNGDPQYNRCWPITKILKELYVKQASNSEKESNDNDVESTSTLYDNSISDLCKLKESDPGEYQAQIKCLEREVNFLFEEFDDDHQILQQDSKLLKRHKTIMELQSSKAPSINSSSKLFCEEYIQNSSSSILKRLEPLKRKETEAKCKKEKHIFFEDMDEELEQIMDGELKFQSYVGLDPDKKLKKIKLD